jgi:hypothetical protein
LCESCKIKNQEDLKVAHIGSIGHLLIAKLSVECILGLVTYNFQIDNASKVAKKKLKKVKNKYILPCA